jgi:hypothetical protein
MTLRDTRARRDSRARTAGEYMNITCVSSSFLLERRNLNEMDPRTGMQDKRTSTSKFEGPNHSLAVAARFLPPNSTHNKLGMCGFQETKPRTHMRDCPASDCAAGQRARANAYAGRARRWQPHAEIESRKSCQLPVLLRSETEQLQSSTVTQTAQAVGVAGHARLRVLSPGQGGHR